MNHARLIICWMIVGMAGAVGACHSKDSKGSPAPASTDNSATAHEAQTSPAQFQSELLKIAMESASSIPEVPHIKDRCKTQEAVVEACLAVELYMQAMDGAFQIKDWRQGSSFADLAFYQAKRGNRSDAAIYLKKAEKIADTEGLEDWRRNTILAKIVPARLLIENTTEGMQKSDGKKDSENEPSFDAQIKLLKELVASGDFDKGTSAVESMARVYEIHYAEAEHRDQLVALIRASSAKLPIFLRIEYALKLCDVALSNKDEATARAFVEEAEGIKRSATWRIENETPLSARLAEYRFRAGDKASAQSSLTASLKKYGTDKELMLNIERVGALLPVAEAYQLISDRAGALSVYKLATEESIVNPNARPRAMDLAAICRSMAVHGCEPDAALWARLRAIQKGLSDPW